MACAREGPLCSNVPSTPMRWRRQREQVRSTATPGEQERIVWLLISEARAEIDLLSENSDSHDVKALGLLGLDGAIILGLTAGRAALPPLWWVAVASLAACTPFFLFTISELAFYFGPNIGAFYEANIGRPALDAGVQLLADLQGYLEQNRAALGPKARSFALGMWLFVFSALFSTAFLLRMALVH
jgi:hypothetical protein